MITEKELQFVREALALARQAGAQKARATLSKSEEDLVATLDGEVDRVTTRSGWSPPGLSSC